MLPWQERAVRGMASFRSGEGVCEQGGCPAALRKPFVAA